MKTKLTPTQRSALSITARGALFRNPRGGWSRKGMEPFQHKTIEKLLWLGFCERATTMRGVPMVRITAAGCSALDITRSMPTDAGDGPTSLHERIAP